MAWLQLLTGLQNLTSGASQSLTQRGDRFGSGIVSEYSPRYYQATKDGICFSASIQSVATTTVGLATAYTGLVISNPITSSVDMVLTKASIMQSVIQSVQPEAYAIAVGFNAGTNVTHTAALTPVANKIGSGATAVGKADTSATLPTAPTYHTFVKNTSSATTGDVGSVIDFDGSLILPPGAYALWVTPAQASVAGLWFSFNWFEVPV